MVEALYQQGQFREIVNKLEDKADGFVRKFRRFLPHIGRICLISTFVEDGFRLLLQWSEQVTYIQAIWNMPAFFCGIFILYNILAQFIGSGLVACRYQVNIAVGVLMSTVLLQTVGYNVWNNVFLLRNLSLIGSLLLLLCEVHQESRSILAGLPSTGDDSAKKYVMLGGRILIILMFVTLIHYGGSLFYLLQSAAHLVLILLVAVGYKTKLCATILVAWLTGMNFYYNQFWKSGSDELMFDYLKYDFFQTWSVIGGLCLIVAYGPGGVSVDDYKKRL